MFDLDQLNWADFLQQIRAEFARLPESERAWLRERLRAIAALQETLDRLFAALDGEEICRGCQGACCGSGRHYLTLTNLLSSLLAGDAPPPPAFSRSCPFLGEAGCLLAVAHRPYNCVSFFCQELDDRMSPGQRQTLAETDRRLRGEYLAVAERYPMAGLRGLWLSLERYGGQSIFHRKPAPVIE